MIAAAATAATTSNTVDTDIESLPPNELREALRAARVLIEQQRQVVAFKQATIDKLSHEMAILKRLKFAAGRAEGFTPEQKSLLEETVDTDIAELGCEIEQLQPTKPAAAPAKQQPKRLPLPAELPRREQRHEPESTTCGCGCAMKRIGEDVAEKLDYEPGVFTVERHVRGKWACAKCQTLVQAPVAAHIIDKGLPTTGLLAQVLVAKYLDHLPLYRQERIFERAGLAIARSTLAQWVGECGAQLQPLVDALVAEMLRHGVLHADETPVAMLKPGLKKTHRAYLWSFCTTSFNDTKAVVFRFAEGRGGENAREFLQLGTDRAWSGKLVVDDFSGYKAAFEMGVTEVGCMAHARRKFFDLWHHHKSTVGEHALKYFQKLYAVEATAREGSPEDRRRLRQRKSRRYCKLFGWWLAHQRKLVPDGSATAKAIEYSLKRWTALTRFIDDGDLPIDNNWVENQIRPIAIGRNNWLFAGSLRAGKRAAAVMSLIHSARMNGLEPYAYLKDVLERLPTQPASRIEELLPHRWRAAATA